MSTPAISKYHFLFSMRHEVLERFHHFSITYRKVNNIDILIHMNTKFIMSIAVLCVVGIGLYGISKIYPVNSVNQSSAVTVSTVPVDEKTNYVTISGSYPQFAHVSEEFNSSITSFVKEQITNHKKNVEDNWKARLDTAQPGDTVSQFPKPEDMTFTVEWTPEVINDEYVSFVMKYGGFEGGAHGYENIKTWNYDVKAQKVMSLADLFPNDSQYLETVSQYTYNDIVSQYKARIAKENLSAEDMANAIPYDMIKEGTSPTEDNFQAFTFTADSIHFYFGQYQVGPYVEGSFEVVMPRAK